MIELGTTWEREDLGAGKFRHTQSLCHAPVLASYYRSDGGAGDVVLLSQIILRYSPWLIFGSYLAYLFLCQLCVSISRTIEDVPSALVHGISNIVGIRSQKQMVGIHAPRIVALMKYVEAIGDSANHQFISYAMGKPVLAIEMYHSVAEYFCMTHPKPALVNRSPRNPLPKTHRPGNGAAGVPLQKIVGLAPLNVPSFLGSLRDSGLVAASALAIAVGDFLRRQKRGIFNHADNSFQLLAVQRGARNTAAAFCCLNHSTVSTMEQIYD